MILLVVVLIMSSSSSTRLFALGILLDDDDDDFFDSELLAATVGTEATRVPSPASSRSGSSGEYNAFFFVGRAVQGGKRASLLLFDDDASEAPRTWLGFVGQGSSKFCTKGITPPSRSCGISKHGVSKFKAVPGCLYIKASEVQAWCQPAFPSED